jgi:hypothetical protein
MKSVPVLISGGAPVGMTLACELSRRGIACMLVERNASTTRYPKMDITNARSMELLTKLSQLGQERLVLSGSFWDVEVSADKPDPKDLAGLLRARRKRRLFESRVHGQKNLRSPVQKDFCNKICQKPTFHGAFLARMHAVIPPACRAGSSPPSDRACRSPR